MKKPRWYKNQSGTMSTIVRPDIALSPAEYRWLTKEAKGGEWGENASVRDVLYHLTKRAIDAAMIAAEEWSE